MLMRHQPIITGKKKWKYRQMTNVFHKFVTVLTVNSRFLSTEDIARSTDRSTWEVDYKRHTFHEDYLEVEYKVKARSCSGRRCRGLDHFNLELCLCDDRVKRVKMFRGDREDYEYGKDAQTGLNGCRSKSGIRPGQEADYKVRIYGNRGVNLEQLFDMNHNVRAGCKGESFYSQFEVRGPRARTCGVPARQQVRDLAITQPSGLTRLPDDTVSCRPLGLSPN